MDIQRLYSAFKECGKVTTDSRSINGGEMFFALKGENFDGNEYALSALESGARYAVVNEDSAAAGSADPRVIAVPDTLEALQALARHHRENTFVYGKRLTVIGLTGTNGKTTTKELITKVLSVKYNVTSTQGNLNNDIGVPLSLLSINDKTQIAVIEMGASHPDDIEKLVKVCEPDYGLITNVGKAHLLGFGSFEGVKAAKGKLYDYIQQHGGGIFLNADDENLVAMAAARNGLRVIKYGVNCWGASVLPSDAGHPFVRMEFPAVRKDQSLRQDLLLRQAQSLRQAQRPGLSVTEPVEVTDDAPSPTIEVTKIRLPLETHLAGSYNAANIVAAIAVGLHFEVSLEDAIQAVSEYIPKNNRSQLEKTARNILIEDAYNANPTSMAAALDNLVTVHAPHKAVMLGDMRELGAESVAEHIAIVKKLSSMDLDLVCLVGEEFRKALDSPVTERTSPVTEPVEVTTTSGDPKQSAATNLHWFPTSDDLQSWLKSHPVSDHTILIKGSRGIRMEKILSEL